MRIAILAPGPSVHTARWTEALAAREHEIHLLTLEDVGHEIDTVRVHRLPKRPRHRYYELIVPLRRLIRRIAPDLVHAHVVHTYGLLARLAGYRPTIVSAWGSDVMRYPHGPTHRRLLTRWVLEYPDAVCTTSDALAEVSIRLGADPEEVYVTPFGVDTETFKPIARARTGERVTVGTVKKLAAHSGIDTLLRAFARARSRLARQAPDISLDLEIIGDGPTRTELEDQARVLGIDPRAISGRLPHTQLPDRVGRFDIFVAPSRTEGFGVAVLEAMSAGVVPVVTDVGGLPDIVPPDVGIIVERDDAEALAEAIIDLALDPDRRSRLGAAARASVVERFEWSRSVDVMENVYRKVVAARRHDTTREPISDSSDAQ